MAKVISVSDHRPSEEGGTLSYKERCIVSRPEMSPPTRTIGSTEQNALSSLQQEKLAYCFIGSHSVLYILYITHSSVQQHQTCVTES